MSRLGVNALTSGIFTTGAKPENRTPTKINNHKEQPKRACGDKIKTNGKPVLISRGPGGKITCDIEEKCQRCPH